ncbi:MAG: hypothetical protein ICCCNLDF_03583 [Planctomycetes bacterium]|nr:hypothetical protein [Planctomycetota bacterium]
MSKVGIMQRVEKVVLAIEGAKADVAITGKTRPITDLGLKSIDGVDCAIALEDEFQITLEGGINPFVNDEKKCARSIQDIVDIVVKHIGSAGGNE